CLIYRRLEACHALLERWELDHDEPMEVVRSFVDLVSAAARENLAAMLGDDRRHEVCIFLVLNRIGDLRARNPIGRHCLSSDIDAGSTEQDPAYVALGGSCVIDPPCRLWFRFVHDPS